MVKGTLVIALDFQTRKDTPHIQYSYRHEGTWYVVKSGSKYSNTFRVTECDEAGLKWLLSVEEKAGKDGGKGNAAL